MEAIEAAEDFDFEDEKTPLACGVCGGEHVRKNHQTGSGEYRIAVCRWCTAGSMNEDQYKKWRAWATKQKTADVRRALTRPATPIARMG